MCVCLAEGLHSCLNGWWPGYLNSCLTHCTAVRLANRQIDYPSHWLAAWLLNSCPAGWSSWLTGGLLTEYLNDFTAGRLVCIGAPFRWLVTYRMVNWVANILVHTVKSVSGCVWEHGERLQLCVYCLYPWVNDWLCDYVCVCVCVSPPCTGRGPVALHCYTIHIV